MKSNKQLKPAIFIQQLKDVFVAIVETPEFISKHRLWEGFYENKPILIFTLFIACLFTISVISSFNDFLSSWFSAPEVAVNAKEQLKSESKKAFDMGGSRFLLLIILQVVIYFFCVKTLNILRSYDNKPTFKDYMRVQQRMVMNMLESAVKAFAIMIAVSVLFGVLKLELLKTPVMFLVYSYYMAYAFLDDYNEQFGFSRKESGAIIKTHMGAAVGFGLFANIISYIPFIGVFVLPFYAAITATIYAERVRMEVVNEMSIEEVE